MSEIRQATIKDIDGILALLLQVGKIHHNGRPDLFKDNATKYTREELIERIKDKNKPIFIYVEEDIILGHLFVEIIKKNESQILEPTCSVYIDDLCIDEKARRKHIGQKMYEFIYKYAKEMGANSIILHVWEFNKDAKEFYKKMGMKERYICLETKLD